MAQSIPLNVPHRDPRVVLQTRLEDAPAAHAEALLAAYEVLQGLHDTGALDMLRGALGSRDKVLDVAVVAAGSADAIRVTRNLLLLFNMLAAIDPEVLKRFTEAGSQALCSMVRQPEPPGIFTLMKDFLWNQDFRRGMAAVNTILEVLGSKLSRNDQMTEAKAQRATLETPC
jgi:uncharacterized protein YjgD (DUF1641 family)